MPTGYQIDNQSDLYYLTFQIVDWVDLLTRKVYRDIILDSTSFCRKHKGLHLYAYVLMSDHVHVIVKARNGDLSSVVRDFKRFTSKKLLQAIKEEPESRRDCLPDGRRGC